jgi:hypothetical protein
MPQRQNRARCGKGSLETKQFDEGQNSPAYCAIRKIIFINSKDWHDQTPCILFPFDHGEIAAPVANLRQNARGFS